jgi:hypothetical protein
LRAHWYYAVASSPNSKPRKVTLDEVARKLRVSREDTAIAEWRALETTPSAQLKGIFDRTSTRSTQRPIAGPILSQQFVWVDFVFSEQL